MKRITFLFILFVPFLSYSQTFKGSVRLGINATQIDGDDLSGYTKLGFHGGLGIRYNWQNNFYLRGEFLYSVKGAKRIIDENNIGSIDRYDRLSMRYVEIPFLLGYRYQKFELEAGLSGGVLVDARIRDYTGDRKASSEFKSVEWATHLGLAYQIKDPWTIFTRFSYSANAVSFGPQGPLFSNPRFRPGFFHNVITLGVNYQFK